MIVINLPMPRTCVACPVRMLCDRYMKWLKGASAFAVPKPLIHHEGCLIMDEDAVEKAFRKEEENGEKKTR